MNRNGIVLVIAVLAVTSFDAMAQTATVTLYGRANMDLEFVKASGAGAASDGSNATVTRVSSNASRFGLRGIEPLGGGWAVFFQVENSVNWDGNGASNANTIANRDTFVGLQGSWGQVFMGRSISPYDDTSVSWSPTVLNYDQGLFLTASVWANSSNGGGNPASGSYDDRYSNSIRWTSPTLNGFTAKVQLATLENTGHGWALIPALLYSNGPIQVGAVYAHHDKLRCYNAAGTSYAPCDSAPLAGLAAKDDAFAIGGLYNFGVLQVGLNYEFLKYQTPTGDLKRNYWGVTGIVPVGGGNLYLYYGNASDGKGNASDGEGYINSLKHGADTGAQNFIIGYSYFLSKRTMLNTGYVLIRNDARARYTFDSNGYSVAPGGDPSGFVLGIVHNF